MYRHLLAVIVLCASLYAPARAQDDELTIGVPSTAIWYACSDRQVAENIAHTFVTQGGNAAMTLFYQNRLLCDQSIAPTELYVQTVVWHREMRRDTGSMKVVLMRHWKDGRPQGSLYVLTLRPVNGSGIAEGGMMRTAM